MAGSIIVNNDCIWSVGTHGFVPVTELTRRRLTPSEEESLADAYAPSEDFQFITLEDLDGNKFCVFYRRCKEAYLGCQQNEPPDQILPQFRDGILKLWSELLEQMRTDPRFDPALCGE